MQQNIVSVASQEVPKTKKVAFFQKELRAGKQEVFRGAIALKKAVQTKTNSLADVGENAKQIKKAHNKILSGRQRLLFAKRKLVLLKKKKFFK